MTSNHFISSQVVKQNVKRLKLLNHTFKSLLIFRNQGQKSWIQSEITDRSNNFVFILR